MDKLEWEALFAIIVALFVATGMAWAGSQDGITVVELPIFALAGVVAFFIQWVAFVLAFRAQTEHWYDLTGSLTYLTVMVGTLMLVGRFDFRSLVLTALVMMWAGRLGGFLFRRVKQAGADTRFDDIKPSLVRFLMAWTLQGLWVFLTLGAALAAMTSQQAPPLGLIGLVGIAIWITGFSIESIADAQKQQFRRDPENKGRFIQSGLWAWSRHPNYFGEITLWVGVALIALPALSGWQLLTLISPVFVYLLLTRASGIPILEERADARWGDDPAYQRYKATTPVLILRRPGSGEQRT
jgi:steroid 5-alpha reductase family enzyme